jgi:hypothetical protein
VSYYSKQGSTRRGLHTETTHQNISYVIIAVVLNLATKIIRNPRKAAREIDTKSSSAYIGFLFIPLPTIEQSVDTGIFVIFRSSGVELDLQHTHKPPPPGSPDGM